MFQESNASSDRLREAAAALRSAEIRPDLLMAGEDAILRRLKATPRMRYRGILACACIVATALAAALIFMPSKSFAAELRRIAQNGEVGMRRVRSMELLSDGTLKMLDECFSDGARTRWVATGNQLLWANGELRYLHPDGATEVHHWSGNRTGLPWNDPADKILAINTRNPNTKVSVEHGVERLGAHVDRFTINADYIGNRGIKQHSHIVLTAEPASKRPLEMQTDETGSPRIITQWEYSGVVPKMLELPPYDAARVYDIDAEVNSVKVALVRHGPRVTVAGQTVELLQFWVDETGWACAIAQANYAHPDNYGIKIDGHKDEAEPEGDPFSGRYHVNQPTIQMGRPIQLFVTNRHIDSPRTTYPDFVSVEIPVFKDKALVGYARFEKVPVNRTHQVFGLLQPSNMPFWNELKRPVTAVQAASP